MMISIIRRPPRSTLFPYTRSSDLASAGPGAGGPDARPVRLAAEGAQQRRPEESATAADRDRRGRAGRGAVDAGDSRDRKSTRLNSSHVEISYAVFCWKKK